MYIYTVHYVLRRNEWITDTSNQTYSHKPPISVSFQWRWFRNSFIRIHDIFSQEQVNWVLHGKISFQTQWQCALWPRATTVNAWISAQLQISAPLWISAPPKAPLPEKKWVSVLGTICETYTVYTVLLMKCDISNMSHFLDRSSKKVVFYNVLNFYVAVWF